MMTLIKWVEWTGRAEDLPDQSRLVKKMEYEVGRVSSANSAKE